MLKELKFVQGAVAKKDLLPALSHFRIEGGHVRSFNGTLALSSPIELDIECVPKAEPFVKAIQNCKDTVTMKLTPMGKLSIKSGSFRAFIDCVDEEETPHVMPEGNEFEIDGEALIAGLKVVAPFIGDDASRPWSNGILIKGQSVFATNNVSLIEYWVGSHFPLVCNIPRSAVREILRIGEAPLRAQADECSISFHYSNGRWIRAALLGTDWPDLSRVLDVPANPQPIDEELYEALEVIKPFVDRLERVYIHDGKVSTTLEGEEGASYDLPDFPYEGVYQLKILNLLKGVAKNIDFSTYPSPCIFYGDRLRGAVIGMRT